MISQRGVRSGVAGRARVRARLAAFAGLLLVFPIQTSQAQETPAAEADSAAVADTLRIKPVFLEPIGVTATREPKELFVTAAPVAVVDTATIRELTPNTAADLLRNQPGVDINGVGTNQTRPTIRGQRGQRILLLENGLRLGNPRRQSDFGELPAIVDVNAVERLEVVRGPASVLYGSDAIGGVLNMITNTTPSPTAGNVFGGRASLIYRSELQGEESVDFVSGQQWRPNVDLFGRAGKVGFRASASYRNANDYFAPAGTFGEITLDQDARVNAVGVEDQNYGLLVDYAFAPNHRVFIEGDHYRADEGGFGFVSNEDLGQPNAADIIITYPKERVSKIGLGYSGRQLNWAVADRLEVSGFYLNHDRDFRLDVFIPFGPPPAGLAIVNENTTDLQSVGIRAEAAKLIGGRHMLTYGLDYYFDDSENSDRSETLFIGGGPPIPDIDETPRVPFATYKRLGVFAQTDLVLHDRVSLIVGGRFQDVRSNTEDTPGLDDPALENVSHSDQTVVAAANLLVEVLPSLNLVGTVGRGFRSPNLIELYFNGPTPEGSGFQVANPTLEAETSINFDVGLKYNRPGVALEIFYFRNNVDNGIRIQPTGDTIGPLPAFQQRNFDELRFQGIEAMAEYSPVPGLTLGSSFSWLDAKDLLTENNPIADSYETKFTADITYRDPHGQWWAGYDFRVVGEQEICAETDEECRAQVLAPAVGFTLPSFDVHNLRGGVRLFQAGRTTNTLAFSVLNLTDALYAEASNATFFRPEPRRTFQVSWITSF